jgi:hypothetical protein
MENSDNIIKKLLKVTITSKQKTYELLNQEIFVPADTITTIANLGTSIVSVEDDLITIALSNAGIL